MNRARAQSLDMLNQTRNTTLTFPLTPTLSVGEREKRSALPKRAMPVGFSNQRRGRKACEVVHTRRRLFPLPEPERCSRKRGARPSRSLCSASRRTAGAADSTHRLVRQDQCSRLVGGTPTRAVEMTALPIFKCIVPAEGQGEGERGSRTLPGATSV